MSEPIPPMPEGDPTDDPIEAFAKLRARETGSEFDFSMWEKGPRVAAAGFIRRGKITWITPTDPLEEVWAFLDDYADELHECGDWNEWPYEDCPVGCFQVRCAHGPNRN